LASRPCATSNRGGSTAPHPVSTPCKLRNDWKADYPTGCTLRIETAFAID
jgi:hypothetical protein